MSDVSGIPYMGPMGQGNFFAPSFSYNPQMSAGQIQSNYMPEAIQSQNVFNNLYASGGGFGRQTDYYSQLGAQYSAAGQSPYGIFGSGGGGGGGASPYQTSSSVWDTGASPFQGGGGSSGFGGNIYDLPSSMFGGASPNRTSSDVWNTGASGFQYPSAGAIDWGGLFSQGSQQSPFSGGAKTDPFPGMSMPGGLNSPMTTPQPQQQPIDYGSLFGRGVGGTSGAPEIPQPRAPAPQPKAADQGAGMFGGLGGAGAVPGASAIDWTKLFDGGSAKADPAPDMAMPGGLNSPMTTKQQQPQDFGSLFGRGAGGTGQPQPVQEEGASFNDRFGGLASPLSGQQPQQPQREASAGDMATQARERATGLLDPYDQPSLEEFQRGQLAQAVAEGEAGRGGMVDRPQGENPLYPTEMPDKIPLPRARPEGADVARPSASVGGTGTPAERAGYDATPRPSAGLSLDRDYRGRDVTMVEQRLRRAVEGGATFLPPGYSIEPTSGYQGRETSQGFHSKQRAEDFQIRGPDGVIPNSGQDYSGMYTLLGRGTKTWVQQNDPTLDRDMRWGAAFETSAGSGRGDTMHFDTGARTGANQGNLNPNSRWTTLQPLSAAEQGAMPAYIPLLGANQVPIEGRVPTGTGSSYSANPVRFGGAPRASEFDNGEPSPAILDRMNSLPSGPEPGAPGWQEQVYVPLAGAPMQRGPENASGGYPGFNPSEDIIDRRGDRLGRDELASLYAQTPNWSGWDLPEPAPNPLSADAGLGNLPQAVNFASGEAPGPTPIAGTPRSDFDEGDAAQQLAAKYGPEALWAAQGQSQFPQAQTQPLGGNDVSRMPYTQQSPIPGASFPVQLYDDPRYGQAEAPPAEAPPQPFPGASEVTQQPYQPAKFDEGNPFFSPTGGAAAPGGGRNFDETFSAFPNERSPQPDMSNFQSPGNDYNTFQQYPFIPPWQASIKDTVNSPEMRDAIQQTAQQQGVKPAAVAGVVNTEDPGWNPRLQDPHSSYVGLTQMGPGTWRSPGMPGIPSFNEYAQNFTGPEQIQAYSQWLDTYGALDRARAAGIDVSALSAEQQAALLQGLQFSPNAGSSEPGARDWLTPYAQGNADVATTLTKNQAPFLVDPATQQPTMNTMTDYYRRLMADQVAGAERRWPQQQLFNTYYPTRMGGQ